MTTPHCTSLHFITLHYTSLHLRHFISLNFTTLHATSPHFTPHFSHPCICPYILYRISSKLNNKCGNKISNLLIRHLISTLSFQLPTQRKRDVNPRKSHLYGPTNKATAYRYGSFVRPPAVKVYGSLPAPTHTQYTLHCIRQPLHCEIGAPASRDSKVLSSAVYDAVLLGELCSAVRSVFRVVQSKRRLLDPEYEDATPFRTSAYNQRRNVASQKTNVQPSQMQCQNSSQLPELLNSFPQLHTAYRHCSLFTCQHFTMLQRAFSRRTSGHFLENLS